MRVRCICVVQRWRGGLECEEHAMNTTTRRYPRTMLEAWSTRHPYAIERTAKPVSFKGVVFFCILGVALGIVAALMYAGI
jgi:hypothetical protein